MFYFNIPDRLINFAENCGMSEKRTEIEELGEFGLINKLTKDLTLSNSSSLLGVGDDAAIIHREENSYKYNDADQIFFSISNFLF
jgi:hypothetical protein